MKKWARKRGILRHIKRMKKRMMMWIIVELLHLFLRTEPRIYSLVWIAINHEEVGEEERDIAPYKEDEKENDDVDYSGIIAPLFAYRATHLFPGLDCDKSFTEQREIILLSKKGDEFKIGD
eukprot:1119085_1